MQSNVKILELIKMAKHHMEDQGFTDVTTFQYLRTWRSVYNFALSRGIEYFSADLAETYMQEKYNLSIGENSVSNTALNPYTQKNIRALRALADFLLHGFIAKDTNDRTLIWPDGFAEICTAFLAYYTTVGYAPQTYRAHEVQLHRFVMFLDSCKVQYPQEITTEHLHSYLKSLCHLSKSTLYSVRGTISKALAFFFENGKCPEDLSEVLPKVYYYAQAKLNKVWTESEVTQMLGAINRIDATGKRDYAIMVLGVNLGLRAGDIIRLTMDNFDWRTGTLNLVQNKTKEPLCLPLSEQVGKAVIDYWQNGRPKTVAEEIFVAHTLPYLGIKVGITYHIFNKYLLSSGVSDRTGRQHGLHALRHSLASRLLEKGTSVNVIGNILGHVNSNTALQYLRIDVNSLRQCALEVQEIGAF